MSLRSEGAEKVARLWDNSRVDSVPPLLESRMTDEPCMGGVLEASVTERGGCSDEQQEAGT